MRQSNEMRWQMSCGMTKRIRWEETLITHFTSSAMVVVMSLRPSRSSAISFFRLDTLFITSSRVFLSSTCCSGDKPLTAAERVAESTEHTHTEREREAHQCHPHVYSVPVCLIIFIVWYIQCFETNRENIMMMIIFIYLFHITECQSHSNNKHDNNPTYSVKILNKYRLQQIGKEI